MERPFNQKDIDYLNRLRILDEAERDQLEKEVKRYKSLIRAVKKLLEDM